MDPEFDLSILYAQIEKLERERDEALSWAGDWHRICQTIATVMDLPEPEGETFAQAVRDRWSERVPAEWYASSNKARNAAEAKVAEMQEAGREAYQACMSAWACGEPVHRVEAMISAVEYLGWLLGEPGAPEPPEARTRRSLSDGGAHG